MIVFAVVASLIIGVLIGWEIRRRKGDAKLDRILSSLETLGGETKVLSDQIVTLQGEDTTIGQGLTDLTTSVNNAIADLKAQPANPALTQVINDLAPVATTLAALKTAIDAVAPAPGGP